MAARIVLFGATGYTGRLTTAALVARGVRPMLASRSHEAVRDLARAQGGLDWALADVSDPASVRALVQPGDVLLSTVGPFARFGDAAVQAAIDGGAHYIDSTGEGAFIRRVFEHFGPAAQAAGVGLLTAFGADWVPGNLAAALALREAGEAAARVEVGYFVTGGRGAVSISGGTRASAAGAMLDPGYALRDGAIVTEHGGAHTLEFEVNGRRRPALSVAGTEAYTLPRLAPSLRDVDVYLGAAGSATRALHVMSGGLAAVLRLPGARPALGPRAPACCAAPAAAPTRPSGRARECTRSPWCATAPARNWPPSTSRAPTSTTSPRDPGLGRDDRAAQRPARHRRARSGRRLRAGGAADRLP